MRYAILQLIILLIVGTTITYVSFLVHYIFGIMFLIGTIIIIYRYITALYEILKEEKEKNKILKFKKDNPTLPKKDFNEDN